MIRSLQITRHPQLSYLTRQVITASRRLTHFDVKTNEERRVAHALTSKLDASWVKVRDISGGCGAMYEISVESETFRGKRMVQQHKLVNQALAAEVKAMHGLRINTNVPGEERKEGMS